jgi:hypothetical protein
MFNFRSPAGEGRHAAATLVEEENTFGPPEKIDRTQFER